MGTTRSNRLTTNSNEAVSSTSGKNVTTMLIDGTKTSKKGLELEVSYFQFYFIKFKFVQRRIYCISFKWFIDNKPVEKPFTPGFAVKNQVEGYTMLLSLASLFFQFWINLFFDWKFLQTIPNWN